MSTSVKDAMQSFAIDKALSYLESDPETNIVKLLDLIDAVTPKDWYSSQRSLIRKAVEEKGNWYQLVMRAYQLDPEVRKTIVRNVAYNASLRGSAIQNENAEKYNCNVPWAMLLDPTSACNLHCNGCWAAEYGNHLNMSLETLDSIITQGKELGTYFYLFTGGEPLVRKKDIIKLCEMHPDCMFMSFTNGTLIDEEFCQEMLRVKNFAPAISVEGFEEANDSRRGEGVFQKVENAMKLLKEHKLPFGVSSCWTSQNWDSISSDEFFDYLIEQGALFIWLFHYMPVGNGASTELLPTPEQRKAFYERIRSHRQTKALFSLDFQHDAEYTQGCIAGGRRYLHINAKGDVEPCAFIHYSTANIYECSVLEALQSPLFMAYRKGQPFNQNHLRPCPMLENPDALQAMVEETGAVSTDYQDPESAEHLCSKCRAYADAWAPMAETLWNESHA